MPGTAQQTLATLATQLGVPYSAPGPWGPGIGWDCSSLMQWGLQANDIACPRSSEQQYAYFPKVVGSPLPGDLAGVFVKADTTGTPQHIGMVTTPGTYINAPHTGLNVMYAPIPNNPPSEYVIGYVRPPYAIPTPPTPPPTPPIPPLLEVNMNAYDPVSGGFWCVTPAGGIEAYDGAPYLGGFPNNQKWNALANGGVVAGLAAARDGNGNVGYVISVLQPHANANGTWFNNYLFPRGVGNAAPIYTATNN